MQKPKTPNSEAGFVSILTVIFFTILITVMTMSFIRLMLQEQQQTLSDALSKNAYAAAQAGVEDAKRALVYCRANPAADGCDTLFNSNCPGGFMTGPLKTALNLQDAASANGIQVGAADANQRYTCVIIQSATPNVTGELQPGTEAATDFIPLTGVGNFNTVRVSWHVKTDAAVELPAADAWVNDANPRSIAGADHWHEAWPAMMRMMVVKHQKNNFRLNSINEESHFVYPANGNNTDSRIAINGGEATRRVASCSPAGGGMDSEGKSYVCTAELTGFNASTQSYLALEAFYSQTDFKVELLQGGTLVDFDGVRPRVDSTGSSADVYRRVRADVKFGGKTMIPAALDSGKQLCKNFRVTGNADEFQEDCGTTTTTPEVPEIPEVPGNCVPVNVDLRDYGGDVQVFAPGYGAAVAPMPLPTPLNAGCRYALNMNYGDSHEAQRAECLAGNQGTCEVWRQPYETFFVRGFNAAGNLVFQTPIVPEIPDGPPYRLNFPASGEYIIQLDQTVTRLEMVHPPVPSHLIVPGRDWINGNSAHLYEYSFTPRS